MDTHSPPVPDNGEYAKLRLDYEQAISQFTMLADIRFKLLAFVPTVSGVAIATFDKTKDAEVVVSVGVLGFIVTLGIVFYDLRNTQFYDAAVHRAKWLEVLLCQPVLTKDRYLGGLFNERPGHNKLLGLIPIWHDKGLALVYSASLGGWVYLILSGIYGLLPNTSPNRLVYILLIVVAGLVAYMFAVEYLRLTKINKPHPVDNEELLKLFMRIHGPLTNDPGERDRLTKFLAKDEQEQLDILFAKLKLNALFAELKRKPYTGRLFFEGIDGREYNIWMHHKMYGNVLIVFTNSDWLKVLPSTVTAVAGGNTYNSCGVEKITDIVRVIVGLQEFLDDQGVWRPQQAGRQLDQIAKRTPPELKIITGKWAMIRITIHTAPRPPAPGSTAGSGGGGGRGGTSA